MMRSRVTLAMMLAAAMDSEIPSPLTMPSWGNGNPLTGRPSMMQWSGVVVSVSAARFMARWVALRMFRLSISSRLAVATDQITAGFEVSSAYNASRLRALIFLESSKPTHVKPSGKTTAAAETGPANGPRPASSMPAIFKKPRDRRAVSRDKSGMNCLRSY